MEDPGDIRGRLRSVEDPVPLLEGIFSFAPVGFQIFSSDGHSLLVNNAFRAMFGTEPPPDYNILRDEVAAANGLQGLVRRAFAGETVRTPPVWYDPRELKHVHSGGRRLAFSSTLFPLFDRRGSIQFVAIVFKDETAELSAREKLEAERDHLKELIEKQDRLEEQLRQSQKMEALGRLAGGVAHDFNNLLTVILGYADMLAHRLAEEDRGAAELAEVRKAGEKAALLTRQLLAFSRKQILAPVVLDLNELILDMDRMLRRLIGEHIELSAVPAMGLWLVRADAGQLQQVVLNLAVNARDAMPSGGRLSISTANAELPAPLVLGRDTVPAGSYVKLCVEDTGVGMDEAVMARIFEPFFTTKGKDKGTGLGLATVYGIVSQSRGHVSVSSAPGRGTRFEIYLPRTDAAFAPGRASAPSAAPGGRETILLVEDEKAVRAIAREILMEKGYRVIDAGSGQEALDLCEGLGSIGLLISDVVMPGMTGPALAARLTARYPGLRVLFVSGYPDEAAGENGLMAGAAFLQKPFLPGDLIRKARELLDAGRPPLI